MTGGRRRKLKFGATISAQLHVAQALITCVRNLIRDLSCFACPADAKRVLDLIIIATTSRESRMADRLASNHPGHETSSEFPFPMLSEGHRASSTIEPYDRPEN
jgi:hypothetical protein